MYPSTDCRSPEDLELRRRVDGARTLVDNARVELDGDGSADDLAQEAAGIS
jgi:hypothetical protein